MKAQSLEKEMSFLNSHKTIKLDISAHEQLQCKMISAMMENEKILCSLRDEEKASRRKYHFRQT